MNGKQNKTKYTNTMKEKLANQISNIRNPRILAKIFDIVYEENSDITTNNNGVFMMFDKLNNETYERIDKIITHFNNRKKQSINSDSFSTDKMEYKPYTQEEFPSQKDISPKLKYSNKEKNYIKKKRYVNTINNNSSSYDIIYTKFDVGLTESDKNSS